MCLPHPRFRLRFTLRHALPNLLEINQEIIGAFKRTPKKNIHTRMFLWYAKCFSLLLYTPRRYYCSYIYVECLEGADAVPSCNSQLPPRNYPNNAADEWSTSIAPKMPATHSLPPQTPATHRAACNPFRLWRPLGLIISDKVGPLQGTFTTAHRSPWCLSPISVFLSIYWPLYISCLYRRRFHPMLSTVLFLSPITDGVTAFLPWFTRRQAITEVNKRKSSKSSTQTDKQANKQTSKNLILIRGDLFFQIIATPPTRYVIIQSLIMCAYKYCMTILPRWEWCRVFCLQQPSFPCRAPGCLAISFQTRWISLGAYIHLFLSALSGSRPGTPLPSRCSIVCRWATRKVSSDRRRWSFLNPSWRKT